MHGAGWDDAVLQQGATTDTGQQDGGMAAAPGPGAQQDMKRQGIRSSLHR